MSNQRKIVLAYSGGLDTSVMIPWLTEHYGAEIIAYTGDLGQGEDLVYGLGQLPAFSPAFQGHVYQDDGKQVRLSPQGVLPHLEVTPGGYLLTAPAILKHPGSRDGDVGVGRRSRPVSLGPISHRLVYEPLLVPVGRVVAGVPVLLGRGWTNVLSL